MSARAAARALAGAVPARWGSGALVLYAIVGQVALGRGIPELAAHPLGVALGLGVVALWCAAAIGAAAAPGPRWPRAGRALRRGGIALLLLGIPASVHWSTTERLLLAEGQQVEAGVLPGLPALEVGPIGVAPRTGGVLLSKEVTVPLRTAGGDAVEVGLWPPALLAGWRLTVLRFGYAPEITWRDASGAIIAEGVAFVGTFPRGPAAALVQWTPPPNVMMGVGYYPPALEDLLSPPGTAHHLFLRLEEASIAGARRDLRDPDAQRWLADGRPVATVWRAQVLEGKETRWSGLLAAGGDARYPAGSLRLGPELTLWVELLAVRDPWLWVAVSGALALALGLVVGAVRRA